MAKYHFTNKSVEDLSSIWNYTFDTWSEKQADLYYEMLISSCQTIAEKPRCGKNYEEISENIYGFRTYKHIIFYKIITHEEVEIVRILHESMDLKSRIDE
ncbi:type II toxin-antitoxin system RelE/ParE family toxin [Dysgonomonas sp. 520]|uniref:type II toxin-antitoxin system RelE/ParE family toxin n=1 Tax=Dysgonomonas sp. 520 TaxID=2302931 RepID=UPI0013D53FF3|nr:type II toxin-antitoxin system RelE/ParE family toxin [Dysgonomonas sp. 520]NDW09494.1 type II toxin-antitoxin system RelE/ParE family toxin [Dysgonomonas sp. 520]